MLIPPSALLLPIAALSLHACCHRVLHTSAIIILLPLLLILITCGRGSPDQLAPLGMSCQPFKHASSSQVFSVGRLRDSSQDVTTDKSLHTQDVDTNLALKELDAILSSGLEGLRQVQCLPCPALRSWRPKT